MGIKRFSNGSRLILESWRLSLVLPGNAGRLHLNLTPRAYSGTGAFRDPHLLAWARDYVDAHRDMRTPDGSDTAADQAGMEALAAVPLEQMHAAVRRACP